MYKVLYILRGAGFQPSRVLIITYRGPGVLPSYPRSGHDSYDDTNPVSLNHWLTKKTPETIDHLIWASLEGDSMSPVTDQDPSPNVGGHERQPFQKVTFSLTIPKRTSAELPGFLSFTQCLSLPGERIQSD